MNALSLLASCSPSIEEGFRYGYVFREDIGRDEYVAIKTGSNSVVCSKEPTREIIDELIPLLPPTTLDVVREHIGRLALLKKIGQASETTMPTIMNSMAFELLEYSQLAILMAFREIKRDPSPWMPTIGSIINLVEEKQNILDKWLDIFRNRQTTKLLQST